MAFFSRALLFMVCDTVFSKVVFINVFIVNGINFISAGSVRHIFLYWPGRGFAQTLGKSRICMLGPY